MDQCLKTKEFVSEWLNHFNVGYECDVTINSSVSLDFYIPAVQLGIYIVNWKRPISVQIANKAIQMQRKMELEQIYLISKEISEPAQKTLDRFGQQITPIHPNGLSELAVSLANLVQSPRKIAV